MNRTGIYFLLDHEKVVYIGQTNNLGARLRMHKKDKEFNRVRFVPCDEDKLNYYECRWINIFKPKYNRANKAFVSRRKSTSGRKELRISEDVQKFADFICENENRTFSNMVETLIINRFNELQKL